MPVRLRASLLNLYFRSRYGCVRKATFRAGAAFAVKNLGDKEHFAA